MRLKARLDCTLIIPASHKTESKALFSAIYSFPLVNFELWCFVSPNHDQPLQFPFAKQKKPVKVYSVVCIVMLENKKMEHYTTALAHI